MKSEKLIEEEQYVIAALKEAIDNPNSEIAHMNADTVITGLLYALGYDEIVRLYNEVHKYYA
jgi:hypothetical protein